MNDPRSARVLSEPRYTYAEADRIAGITRGTSKRWLKGYQFPTSFGIRSRVPVPGARPIEPGVSFLELVEVAAIDQLRSLDLPLTRIRKIVEDAQRIFDVERPLVTLRFKVGGRSVFVQDTEESLVSLSGTKRLRAWDQILAPFLDTVDYGANEVAARWWPMGRDHQVVVDPEYGFGQPVLDGTGIRTEIIWEQLLAGGGRDEIAFDFGLSPHLVEQAIRFEATRIEALASAS